MRNLLVCILAFFYVCNASAQVKWKHKPFSEKCFVENKGQVNPTVIIKEPVLFTAQVDGNNYYFTQHYFYIAQPVKSKTPRAEIKKYLQSFNRFIQEEENEEVYEKLEYTFKEEFLEFGWKNTSPYCKVWPGKKVNHYYSYGGPALKNGKQTILANAFETLRYNNLYDGIDLVFEFPADSTGIKYHFEVQQSANVNDIVLVLPEAAKPTMVAGNVEMKASFGKITDHAPVSFCHGTHAPVKSTCQLRGNELSFKLDETARNGLVIIDPWVAVPSFSSSSKAFDVDYDSNGFTYAHGGASPFQIQKFDPTGALVWTYTPSFTGFSSYYGDFAVDRVSNRIYVVQGFNPGGGSEVIKINSSAIVEATYGGDPQFVEMWRIAFSRCSNQAVIAGGGISSPTYQTCYLDTNLTSLTPVQFVPTTGCCHDVGLLALDDLGNAYECTNRRASFDGIYDNRLVKLPLPAMLPETYNVATDYLFIEAGSVYYYGGSPANGFNGMSTYGDQVYTYDGFVLKKFDGPTGAQTVYKRIHMPADSTEMYWGGLTSDNCGNLFLGIQDTVEQYNASLNLLNTYVQPGTVYDVVFGTNGNLYVCGDGFVTEILPDSVTPCVSGGLNTVLTVNDANCTSPGSASVSITGGVGPYDIVWNTTPPQTNDTITNVPPGTYIVTVTEKSCFHEVTVDTFNIDTVGGAFIPVSQMYPGCGSGASIDIDILGGHGPFTYTWTPSAPNTDSIFGLVPGTYTVDIVDDATCTGSITVVVDTAVPPNYNLVAPLFCVGDTGTVQLVITGPDGPFTINWSSPVGASGSVLHGVTAGVYSGIIVNNSGCMQKFTDTILASPAITVSSTAGFDCSIVNSGEIQVTAGGGDGPLTYEWTGFPFNTTDLLSGVGPGVYTITVTDSVGCSVSLSDTIETYSPLNITATVTSTCFGGASGMIDVNVTGGMVPPAYAYTWSSLPGETTDVADQLGPGSYNVTVTSGPCTASQTYTVNSLAVVDSLSLATTYCSVDPSAVVCPVYGSATITAYQWGYDWGPVTGATGPTYASPVDSLNAVTLYWTGVDGCNYFTDDIAITLYTVGGAIQQVNVFSPNGDGQNDVFYPYTAFAFDGVNFMDEYDLKIFDRWGVEVFASTDLTVSWNGKKQNTGEAVADGIYYWVMNVFNHCTNEKEEVHSFVHVMR